MAAKGMSSEEVAQRRVEVWEMKCQGVPTGQIARLKGVSRQTIHGDMVFIKKKFSDRTSALYTSPDAQTAEIGQIIGQVELIAQNAFMEYALANTPMAKDKLLNTALKALSTKARLGMEMGFLPKAKDKAEITVTADADFASRFGEANPLVICQQHDKGRRVLDAAERFLKLSDDGVDLATLIDEIEEEPEE